MENAKTIAVNVVAALVIGLVMTSGAVLYRQNALYAKGERAATGGYGGWDFPSAVAGYEAAIHMYVPGSPLVEKSAAKLWEMGQLCEQNGDATRALIAYRSLRSSFYAVTWLTTPGKSYIDRCDARIAQLVKVQGGK
ncbi:hypothetical protein L4X63_03555 [Geomonas sp. Red32]|uniref:hypothetical protein n=1 Tax=Geomonas sp. Red32 TaxID=2912856 RepID=UPI00202D0987|nr:hypothetical protein [Geomonas sp. Red32]MCM0080661.1 hypothetical protein [Geomonas sp. Red32]